MAVAIGVDFGTESGRALLLDLSSGEELAVSVVPYPNAVIDRTLPTTGEALPPDWALQDPEDYLATFRQIVPAVMRSSGVDPGAVIGIGIDFTSCTILPVTADGTPLCLIPEFRGNPHSWVKLWKHHAAQPEADLINETARRLGESWLDRYGGKYSSEWYFAKVLQILREAPEIYASAAHIMEAADWVVWQLTGRQTRNLTAAGYKAMWSKREGFPRPAFFAALDPRLENVVGDKIPHEVQPLG